MVELVDTIETRALGLSFREGLSASSGMLFIFEDTEEHGFWMKDMRFPIDIAWLDEDFCIIHIEQNLAPSTYPTVYEPNAPARYVLEVSAGFFESRNAQKGDCIEAPARW